MEVEIYKIIYGKDKYADLLKKHPNVKFFESNIFEIYKNNKNRTIILGKEFVKNNSNKGRLVINNKKCKLKEFIENKKIKKDKLKIGIILSKNIYNKNYMFKNCYDLLKFSSYIDVFEYVDKEFEYVFEEDEILIDDYIADKIESNNFHQIYKNLKDDTENTYTKISTQKDKYSNCSIISDWNKNIKNNQKNKCILTGMFYNCRSLSSLSDISIWNTHHVINMSYMFENCFSLSSLPDISKWNTNNVTDMSDMFYNCESLSSLSDISKWDTNNVTDMSGMFSNCISLSSLPDISKWNTNNVTDMRRMFWNCYSLLSLPDISKWEMG